MARQPSHTHFQAIGDKSIIVDIISSHFVRRNTEALKFILIISLSCRQKAQGGHQFETCVHKILKILAA